MIPDPDDLNELGLPRRAESLARNKFEYFFEEFSGAIGHPPTLVKPSFKYGERCWA